MSVIEVNAGVSSSQRSRREISDMVIDVMIEATNKDDLEAVLRDGMTCNKQE